MRQLTPLFVTVLLFVLVFSLAVAAAEPAEIVILHTNDMHGRLQPIFVDDVQRGGLARIAAYVQVLRELYPNRVLWLDGGDTFHGTNLANLFDGEPVLEALNAADLDAMTWGNHDFNFGTEVARELAAEARFPILGANIIDSASGRPFSRGAAFFDLDGVTVAVLGLTTADTPLVTLPRNVAGLTFLDPVDVAGRLVPVLRDEADVVVVLSHLGIEEELRLARLVPGIDVIVGGHSHTRLDEPIHVGNTVLVQANDYGKFLGYLKLTVGDQGILGVVGQLLPITADSPVRQDIQALVDRWEHRLDERLRDVVGTAAVDLKGEAEDIRRGETNLGNLIADVMRATAGAEIALVNSGGIRATIEAGEIRLWDVYTVLPFDNVLVGLELTGEQILAALEHSVSRYPFPSGGFLQVSGLTFVFDVARPPGQRVVEAYVDGRPLDPERVYRVATNDFLAAGGDGYSMLAGAPMFYGSKLADGEFLRDVFLRWIQEQGTVAAELECRIAAIEETLACVPDVAPELVQPGT